MAMGIWIDRQHESSLLPKDSLWAGATIAVGGLALSWTLGLQRHWFGAIANPAQLVTYAGVVLMLFGLILRAVHGGGLRGSLRLPLRLLLGIGILAFVVYVAQELVMSLNQALMLAGLSRGVSLLALLAIFVTVVGVSLRRLYRLYYG
jgi:hypothetical protein